MWYLRFRETRGTCRGNTPRAAVQHGAVLSRGVSRARGIHDCSRPRAPRLATARHAALCSAPFSHGVTAVAPEIEGEGPLAKNFLKKND